MANKKLVKFIVIFGGGAAIWALYNYYSKKTPSTSTSDSTTKSFDSVAPSPDTANIDVVASAYGQAMTAGEPASRLSELNKELLKEFGMKCYFKDGKIHVCDASGKVISTK